MQTTVTELPDSQVRVEAEVPADDVTASLEAAAERLGAEMKIPGFREGKVPSEMVVQRLGRDAVLNEALEGSLPAWYVMALGDAQVRPVGDPNMKLEALPEEGDPLKFSFEVSVRPPAELGEWKGVEAAKPETEVPGEAVDAELERLREAFARLDPVDRSAKPGDFLLADFEGTLDGEPLEGGSGSDELLELGGGRMPPEFDAALGDAKAGDRKEVSVDFPDDHEIEELQGKTAEFEIEVKEVREKSLPELDDDFAMEASEFDTLAALREEISSRIEAALESQAEAQFREAALDAAVDASKVELPDAVVRGRAEEMWRRLESSLAQRGISGEQYAELQGKTRDEMIDSVRPDAERALKREAVLEAVADAEAVEIGEAEMLEALAVPPGHEDHGHPEPADALETLRASGREGELREELRLRRALERIAEEAKPIAVERAEAREQIWTPEKEREEKGGLWTPGQEPPAGGGSEGER